MCHFYIPQSPILAGLTLFGDQLFSDDHLNVSGYNKEKRKAAALICLVAPCFKGEVKRYFFNDWFYRYQKIPYSNFLIF